MITLVEKSAEAFNRVMEAHSIAIHSHPQDFTPGSQCIFIGCNDGSQALAQRIFDELFKPAPSGIYHLYMTYESFLATMGVEGSARTRPAKLRFFSTNKNSSKGEYCPLCIELGLDKDWRQDGSGIAGHQSEWMDDLYYRSFAACPKTETDRFWREFAANGTGVRLAIEVKVPDAYPDFRFVTYEGSEAVAALVEVRSAIKSLGYNLRIQGFPRMPAFGQLDKYRWQREARLITKRFGAEDTEFPWQVFRSSEYGCNYIDCSLTQPDSTRFSLRLLSVTPGPNTSKAAIQQSIDLFDYYQKTIATTLKPTTGSP